MFDISNILANGAASAWLYVPFAVLLGALHGLEPGHSKTMMAAFIVAVRGTVGQAVLLGVAATVSHTLIVWIVALGGLTIWQGLDPEETEPYFQLASAGLIIIIALWMLWRTYEDQTRARHAAGHRHGHDHGHGHSHDHGHDHDHGLVQGDGGVRRIDTGHGVIAVAIATAGGAPRWRVRVERGQRWPASDVRLETERPDGVRQAFAFAGRGRVLDSVDPVPEPHDFMARLTLGHGDHTHDYDLSYLATDAGPQPLRAEARGLELATDGYQDAHELAHANDIRRRFSTGSVTTGQIILFGLTGGLIPCPAAITVLLLCLQVRQVALGAVVVLAFSIGLALTLVAVGAVAALGVRHATERWSWFSTAARRAPYLSGAVIILVGLYMGFHAVQGLTDRHDGAETAAVEAAAATA